MKKKIVISTLLFILVFGLSNFLKFQYVKAAATDALGWLWGGSKQDSNGATSGVGWISLNNLTDGSSVSYGVTIPSGSGNITGFAWSENMGWIDFNSQDHCITSGTPTGQQYKAASCTNLDGTTGAYVEGVNLKGWIRFVNIAEASADNNSGGWDGWVKLNADPALGYEVKVDPSTGNVSGYAWSSELGAISFSTVTSQTAPNVTLNAYNAYLNPGETFAANPPTVNVSWTVAAGQIDTCSRTCKNSSGNVITCAGWTGNTSTNSGNVDVVMPDTKVTFTLTCTDKNTLSTTKEVIVEVGCSGGTCNSSSQTCNAHTGVFHAVTSGDAAVCKEGCSTDSDCALRKGNGWREVAP